MINVKKRSMGFIKWAVLTSLIILGASGCSEVPPERLREEVAAAKARQRELQQVSRGALIGNGPLFLVGTNAKDSLSPSSIRIQEVELFKNGQQVTGEIIRDMQVSGEEAYTVWHSVDRGLPLGANALSKGSYTVTRGYEKGDGVALMQGLDVRVKKVFWPPSTPPHLPNSCPLFVFGDEHQLYGMVWKPGAGVAEVSPALLSLRIEHGTQTKLQAEALWKGQCVMLTSAEMEELWRQRQALGVAVVQGRQPQGSGSLKLSEIPRSSDRLLLLLHPLAKLRL